MKVGVMGILIIIIIFFFEDLRSKMECYFEGILNIFIFQDILCVFERERERERERE